MERSPLFAQLEAAQAQFVPHQGWEQPACFGPVEGEYWALKEGAGLLDLSPRGRLLVRGEDAPRFLHGMVTNEVKDLEPGRGNYAFLLDVHGHILADARVLRLDAESYLVDCDPQLMPVIRGALERHIISDIVELEDASRELACIGLEGPCSREILRETIEFDPPDLHLLEHLYLEDIPARLIRATWSGEEGYWLLAPPGKAQELWQKALQAGGALDGRPVGLQATEIRRIELGIPRHGQDISDKTLPQETGQMRAISFTKGCYIGQEVVERIRSRGHVNRRLMGLLLEGGEPVPPAAEIFAGDRPVGTVTSSAYSFRFRRTLAMGYLRREHCEAGTSVRVGTAPAEVAELPFFLPTHKAN